MRPADLTPETCKVGDLIDKRLLADWPPMTDLQAVNFRRWTGHKLGPDRVLVRKGKHIFQIDAHRDKAQCVYCHDRQF